MNKRINDMYKSLYGIYDLICRWNERNCSSMSVLKACAKCYVEFGKELPDGLKKAFAPAVPYINFDTDGEKTIEDYAKYGDELLEGISGVLGEYFSD